MLLAAQMLAALLAANTSDVTFRVFALSGDAPVEIKRTAGRAIRDALAEDGRDVTLEEAPIAVATVVFGCSANEPACIRSIATALDAGMLIHGRLDKEFRLRLTFDHRDGRVLSTLDVQIDPNSLDVTAARAARDLVARGLGTSQVLGVVRVRSVPPGAEVFRSGSLIGRTPLEVELPVGRQLLELRADDRFERRVVEVTKAPTELDVDLTPKVIVASAVPSAEPSSWVAPGITIGVGAVALVVSAVLLSSASSTQSDLDDGVANVSMPPTSADLVRLGDLDQLASDGQSVATGGYVALGAGIVAIASGVVWGLVSE